jgi:hypothetical protein
MSTMEKIGVILAGGIIGITLISVTVSKNSDTPQVLNAGGASLSKTLTAAEGSSA